MHTNIPETNISFGSAATIQDDWLKCNCDYETVGHCRKSSRQLGTSSC